MPALFANAVRPVTRREFALYQALVESELGIHLAESKQALVNARLTARIRELGLATFSDYYERATGSDREELVRLLDAICTNETHFFREPHHFELLRETMVPRWLAEAEHGRRPKRVSLWSAGCSSGEEPYSLAMGLLAELPADWSIDVLASDVSSKALGRARDAVYPMRRLLEIPAAYHQPFLLRGIGEREGLFKIAPEVRRRVRFEHINLVAPPRPQIGKFDLVSCRNVLIYFSAETRRRVVSWLCAHLADLGYLWIGHAESLHDGTYPVRTVVPTVYRLANEIG